MKPANAIKIVKYLIYSMFLIALASFVNASISDNIEAVWKFENNLLDTTTKHNLSNFGSVSYENCLKNNCSHLDGSTNYFILNATSQKLSGTVTNMTISFWIKFDSIYTNSDYFFQFDAVASPYFGAGIYDSSNIYWWIGTNSDGGSVNPTTALGLVSNKWYHVAFVYRDRGNASFYWNGTKIGSVGQTTTSFIWNSANPQWIGNLADAPTRFFDGYIDEFYIFVNKSLNSSEILQLSANNSITSFYPFVDETIYPNITNINLLDDITHNKVNLASISQFQEFYLGLNYSYSNSTPINNAQCNMSITNSSAVFKIPYTGNYTINSTSQQVSLFLNEDATNLFDTLKFSVCRGINKGTALIYVNGSLYKTVNDSIIPPCNLGVHQENNITRNFISNISLNITIKCLDCTGGANTLTLVKDSKNNLVNYYRSFNNHTEALTFNTTSSLYEYNYYPYRLDINGTVTAQAKCTNTNINITQINASAKNTIGTIVSLNDLSFVNNTAYEVQANNTFIFEFSEVPIISINKSLYYATGNQIISIKDQSESLVINSASVPVNAFYNVSACALDINYLTTCVYGIFSFNDSTIPTVNFYNPLIDNSSSYENATSFYLNATLRDVNLFAYELLILNPLGDMIYNFTQVSINTSEINILESINANETGTWTLIYNVTDSHTALEISDYQKIIEDKSIIIDDKFEYDDNDQIITENSVKISYTGQYPINKIEVNKKIDRYNFEYEMSLGANKLLKEVQQQFKVECENLFYIEKSDYPAHFVCWKEKKWIDFSSSSLKSYKVVSCGNDCYYVNAVMYPDEKIVFNSIGGLNSVSGRISYDVHVPIPPDTTGINNFDFTSQTNIMILFCLIFLYIGVMALGFAFKNKGFVMMGIFIGIIIGLIFISFSVFLTLAIMFINVMMFFLISKTFK